MLGKRIGLRLGTEKQLVAPFGSTLGTELQMMVEAMVGLRLWEFLGSIPWSICISILRIEKISLGKLDVRIASGLIKTQKQKNFNAACEIIRP